MKYYSFTFLHALNWSICSLVGHLMWFQYKCFWSSLLFLLLPLWFLSFGLVSHFIKWNVLQFLLCNDRLFFLTIFVFSILRYVAHLPWWWFHILVKEILQFMIPKCSIIFLSFTGAVSWTISNFYPLLCMKAEIWNGIDIYGRWSGW